MYAIIMAGGIGARFWPKSRTKHPKQLLKIVSEQTLIQSTISRLKPIIDTKNIYIVSTENQIAGIKKQLPFITNDNLIIEPKGKNTAPCIGLSAIFLKQFDPNAVMIVLPADHYIKEEKEYQKILLAAEKAAIQEDTLVTIGIKPTYPSTGYGYIQYDNQLNDITNLPIYKVKTFAEKPDVHTAERFIKSGDFLWNSGMFIWKVETILREIEESLPELYDGLLEIEKYLGTKNQAEVITKVYCQIKNISIDYGVMEHSKNVSVIKSDFGWSDVGSWEEVYKLSKKDNQENVCTGDHFFKDTHRCLIDVPNKFVATLGIDDLVVIESDDALLICKRDKSQTVKELVENLKRKKLNKYL